MTKLPRLQHEIFFGKLSTRCIQEFIDGCHRARQYDDYFYSACRVRNDREGVAENGGAFHNSDLEPPIV